MRSFPVLSCVLIAMTSMASCSWVMSDPLDYPEDPEPRMDMTIADRPPVIPEVIGGDEPRASGMNTTPQAGTTATPMGGAEDAGGMGAQGGVTEMAGAGAQGEQAGGEAGGEATGGAASVGALAGEAAGQEAGGGALGGATGM